jgi:hypothetical protein
MPKGFTKLGNLSQSDSNTKDFNALNNLTNQAARDIQLFSNNNQNKSVIESSKYTTSGNDITITVEGYLPFSNGTTVTHNGSTYTVVESDGKTNFRLYDSESAYFVPTADITRTDRITNGNLLNLNTQRLPTFTEESADDVTNVFSLYTIQDSLSQISATKSTFEFAKQNFLLSYENNTSEKNIETTGYIEIVNPSNTSLDDSESPGIYIFSQNSEKRAFTDRTNPWSEVSGNTYIETTADSMTVEILKLETPNILGTAASITSSSGAISNFTHKMEVEINGETYYLLLKDE